MINQRYIETKSSFGHMTRHLLLKHKEGSRKLVVLFPGGNGHCDIPVLHYARKVTLEAGCDVLSLEYGYLRTEGGYDRKHFDVVLDECKEAIDSVITQYDDVYFIAKSFGTLVCGGILQQMNYSGAKVMYLTPLEYTIPHILGIESTVVVGARDRFFTPENIDMIKGQENITLHVIEEATHSLEIRGSFEKSIDILHGLCNLYKSFVTK